MISVVILGAAIGCVYSLLALGFILVFAASGVGSFAQVTFATYAAFTAYVLAINYRLPVYLAIALGIACAGGVALLSYLATVVPLAKAPYLYKSVATLPLTIVLTQLAKLMWGTESYQFPAYSTTVTVQLGDLPLPFIYLAIASVSVVTALMVYLFLHRTRLGVTVRAVTQNPWAAEVVGVRLIQVGGLVWLLGGAVAGVAGVLIAPLSFVNYSMADPYLVPMFAACALGGLNSVWGALVGGVLLGILQGLLGQFVPGSLIPVVSVAVLLCVFAFRPEGLFGSYGLRHV